MRKIIFCLIFVVLFLGFGFFMWSRLNSSMTSFDGNVFTSTDFGIRFVLPQGWDLFGTGLVDMFDAANTVFSDISTVQGIFPHSIVRFEINLYDMTEEEFIYDRTSMAESIEDFYFSSEKVQLGTHKWYMYSWSTTQGTNQVYTMRFTMFGDGFTQTITIVYPNQEYLEIILDAFEPYGI